MKSFPEVARNLPVRKKEGLKLCPVVPGRLGHLTQQERVPGRNVLPLAAPLGPGREQELSP